VSYTPRAIESLNCVLRKATRQRTIFPTDDTALKVVFLAIVVNSESLTLSG